MKALYDLPAPAKLNAFLHVIGRRADGYHLLQSVFVLIDWCDVLHIEKHSGHSLSRNDFCNTNQKLPKDDLCIKAANLLQQATGYVGGAHITLEKHIPQEAGMGGGSSDAATVLIALNRLWNLKLSIDQLAILGMKLGADVPFFIHGRNAWVEGIGEAVTPLDIPETRFIVIKPPTGIETKQIFLSSMFNHQEKSATIDGFVAGGFDFGHNTLQAVAQVINPQVGEVVSYFSSVGLDARMTGSGSAVFAPIKPGLNNEAIAGIVAGVQQGFRARLCSSLAAHPLRWVS